MSRDEALRESERPATSMSLPLAVHHRLDLLAEGASYADATRAEIVGMLICDASLDVEELERAVLRYRKLKVGDVIPEKPEETSEPPALTTADNVVSIKKRGPGRRAGRQEIR